MRIDIINANGKIIGYIEIFDDKIDIYNGNKPIVSIFNKEHLNKINNKDYAFITVLYDDYTLTIAEIAAIYNEKYFHIADKIKNLPIKTKPKAGRRNSSYGVQFSQERCNNISKSNKGHSRPSTYIRTSEIKKKISKTLKEGYETGRIKQDPVLKSKAWADGKYANAKMGRGIQGFFHSIKNNKDVYFRSLMELNFFIIIENDNRVKHYDVEPFQIKLPHKMHYTPDVFINDNILVELKPRDFYKYTDFDRFCVEMACMNDYCNKHHIGYIVVYDDDINFESKKYRKYLKENPDIIRQYNVRFKKEIQLNLDWS